MSTPRTWRAESRGNTEGDEAKILRTRALGEMLDFLSGRARVSRKGPKEHPQWNSGIRC